MRRARRPRRAASICCWPRRRSSNEPGLPADLHLTARQAGEHAARAGAKRLVLTHLVPWNDDDHSLAEAKASGYRGQIELAVPGGRVRACRRSAASAGPVSVGLTHGTSRRSFSRPAPSRHHPPRLAHPRGGLGARGVRRHARAVRRHGAGLGAAVAPRLRASAGSPPSTRCCRARPHPQRPRVGQGQDRRPYARDLPPRRPVAARLRRLQGARREHHPARLRRAGGRRRHPYGRDHRGVRRAGRRDQPGCATGR